MSGDEIRLLIKMKGDVTYVKFGSARRLANPEVEALHDRLVRFIYRNNCQRIMINFSDVEYLSSGWLGKLINLYKSLQNRGISLCIFNVNPQIYEIFSFTKLDKILDIRENNEDFDDDEYEDGGDDDDDGGSLKPSPLNRPKPPGGKAVILPFPSPERN